MDDATKKRLELTRLIRDEVMRHRRNPARSLKPLRSMLPKWMTVDKLHRKPGHLRFTVKKSAVRGEEASIVGMGHEVKFFMTMIIIRHRGGHETVLKDRFGLRSVRRRAEW